jgi:predicted PolB exonuclease-like 3'-5' exonuclease
MVKPKILFFDIETTPNLVFTWGVGKSYVTHESIFKERKISCICYKWADEKIVHSLKMDIKKHLINDYDDDADKKLLEQFLEVYKKADLAVAHNGDHFDIATIKARLVKYGLPSLTPTLLDDSYLQSKKIRFNSHRLDYLGQYLGVGRKTSTSYGLWLDVMHGSKKALTDTVNYCKQDVILLEKVYKKLKPHINSKLNMGLFHPAELVCKSCGSSNLRKDGLRYNATTAKQQYECADCYSKSVLGTAIRKAELR